MKQLLAEGLREKRRRRSLRLSGGVDALLYGPPTPQPSAPSAASEAASEVLLERSGDHWKLDLRLDGTELETMFGALLDYAAGCCWYGSASGFETLRSLRSDLGFDKDLCLKELLQAANQIDEAAISLEGRGKQIADWAEGTGSSRDELDRLWQIMVALFVSEQPQANKLSEKLLGAFAALDEARDSSYGEKSWLLAGPDAEVIIAALAMDDAPLAEEMSNEIHAELGTSWASSTGMLRLKLALRQKQLRLRVNRPRRNLILGLLGSYPGPSRARARELLRLISSP